MPIQRIAVVDDDPNVRSTYSDVIYDMDLEVVDVEGPLGNLESAIEVVSVADAVLCDHRLVGYASFDGAEFAATLYKHRKPAILCTQWKEARNLELALYREWLPAVLEPPPEPGDIRRVISACLDEFDGDFRRSRKAWRTLIRVENVRSDGPEPAVEMVVPGWNPHQVVPRPLRLFSSRAHSRFVEGFRFHAWVNIGAEEADELYFTSVELPDDN